MNVNLVPGLGLFCVECEVDACLCDVAVHGLYVCELEGSCLHNLIDPVP